MAVTIFLELRAKQGTGNDLLAMMKAVLPDTRDFDGCHGLDVYQNQDEPDVLMLVEDFESKAHYEKYLGWRQETGVFEQLVQALDGEPSLRFFDQTDA